MSKHKFILPHGPHQPISLPLNATAPRTAECALAPSRQPQATQPPGTARRTRRGTAGRGFPIPSGRRRVSSPVLPMRTAGAAFHGHGSLHAGHVPGLDYRAHAAVAVTVMPVTGLGELGGISSHVAARETRVVRDGTGSGRGGECASWPAMNSATGTGPRHRERSHLWMRSIPAFTTRSWNPSRIRSRKLLVEGATDRRVIPWLMEANGVAWEHDGQPVVYIEPNNGIEDLRRRAGCALGARRGRRRRLRRRLGDDIIRFCHWPTDRRRAPSFPARRPALLRGRRPARERRRGLPRCRRAP